MIALLTIGALSHGGVLSLLGLVFGFVVFGICVTAPYQSVELGSALGSCPVGPRCEASPIPRDWKLIDRIDPSRGASPGGTVITSWNNTAPMDDVGRYRHIKSVLISFNAVFEVGEVNDHVTAYQGRSLIHNMNFSDAGRHFYLAKLEGRTCIDLAWLRDWKLPYPLDGEIPKDVGAGTITVPMDLEIELVSRAPGADPLDGLLLLSAIQQTDGSQGFSFDLRDAIKGNPTAPAGLTLLGFTRGDGKAGIDMWADYVALDNPVIGAPWSWREYTKVEIASSLQRPEEKTIAAAIRFFPEDQAGNTGQQYAAGYDEITFEIASQKFGQVKAVDQVTRERQLARSAPSSAASLGLPDLALPVEPGVTRGMLLAVPCRPVESAPAGPVIYDFGTTPTTGIGARWIHITVKCDTTDRAERILATTKCGPSSCVQPGSNMVGITDPTAPKIILPISTKSA